MDKPLRIRIVELLESRPYDTFTSKQIAYLLSANKNSVRTKLSYLVTKNEVWKVSKGLYQCISGLVKEEYDPYIRFHGIKFEHRCIKSMGWSYHDLYKIITEQLREPWIRKHPKNGSITTSIEWEGRIITITLHPSNDKGECLLEVFNKSSLLPLHPLEFSHYCGVIQGTFKIPSEFWILKQIGINIDITNTQLDSWKSISMKDALGNVLRMYQKAKDLRLESHITTKINGKDALKYMERILIVADELVR